MLASLELALRPVFCVLMKRSVSRSLNGSVESYLCELWFMEKTPGETTLLCKVHSKKINNY